MKTPKYIYGKDFHKNIGKTILMPHPTDPTVMPLELLISKVENKQITLALKLPNGGTVTKTDNYSKDKNKYLVIE